MIGQILRIQSRSTAAWSQIRMGVIAAVAITAAGICVQRADHPAAVVELVTWTVLLTSILGGGLLTGWRVTQFPKTRAAELHLVLPVDDWSLIASEVIAGMAKSTLVVAGTAPAVAWLVGCGWMSAAAGAALLAVSLAGGWLAGLVLAVVAYEPAWFRRAVERLVLVSVIGYLVLFGLLGSYVLPPLVAWWESYAGGTAGQLSDIGWWWRYLNPFRLLGALSQESYPGLLVRVAAVLGLLGTACAACVVRLAMRLRSHYQEENYAPGGRQLDSVGSIRENPLAWWMGRRVSQFRGNVNLYLAWCTVALFGGWLCLAEHWPPWLAVRQMQLIESWGGAALLGAAAIQLAVVPVAFLRGLWDSNPQQRTSRLELLLVTLLGPRDFLWASVVAAWIRGRGYVLAALIAWIAAAASGKIPWTTTLLLCAVSGAYILLCFAVAFRSFTGLTSQRAVNLSALAMAIGPALAAYGLYCLGDSPAAAAIPPGAVYVLGLPAGTRSAESLLPVAVVVAVLVPLQVILAWLLLRRALGRFDQEIRTWFAKQLS